MKLYSAAPSPFVRKVRILVMETGLSDRVEEVDAKITPINPSDDLNQANPIGKIPALATDDGMTLFDSRVICEYLDTQHRGAKMFPANGAARWTALRRQALADGVLDAGVNTRYETFLRPEEQRWPEWIDGQKGKIRRGVDALEAEVDTFGDTVDVGTIAAACALGYLDFRFPDDDWRDGHPKLAAWFEAFSARPSMQATVPA